LPSVDCRLAVDAVGGPRQRFETRGRNLAATPDAHAERALVESSKRRVDLLEVLDRAFAQGEVALLFEDLACGRRLRAIGHLVGHLDGFTDLLGKAGALGRQPGAERLCRTSVHPLTLRAAARGRTLAIYSQGVPRGASRTMATETDPVCGMEVDPATSQLSLEHEGTTYWFCSRGCLLEFKDNPETYLAPDYVPSM
jgi:YHS domain-containing protein